MKQQPPVENSEPPEDHTSVPQSPTLFDARSPLHCPALPCFGDDVVSHSHSEVVSERESFGASPACRVVPNMLA